MEYLALARRNRHAAIYELKGEYGDSLTRYIASTPESREICNRPEITGVRYTDMLESAVTAVLTRFPPAASIRILDPRSIGVVHFLRGSLNFGMRRALFRAYGFNTHSSSFITSQRERDQYGRWYIKDNQYRKILIPTHATIFFADVIATGVTISNGMDIIVNLAKNSGTPIKQIFFFTIGCHKLEKLLRGYHQQLSRVFPGYERTCAVYLEGKFHLADSKTGVRIKLQGTDLMRHPCLLTPEFELSQYESPFHPLERCTIYDAGTRAFDIADYMRKLEGYWREVRSLAEKGWTLEEALRERWPAEEYSLPFREFKTRKGEQWRGVSEGFLKRLYSAHRRRWTRAFAQKAKSPRALIELCDERLKLLAKAR
ncbi:MAG: hypothetical protein NT045_08545 [Candidatus Aureabacteria bacterium]|nr:hypothetical protein [Candidatus Auribacterota bacterium]